MESISFFEAVKNNPEIITTLLSGVIGLLLALLYPFATKITRTTNKKSEDLINEIRLYNNKSNEYIKNCSQILVNNNDATSKDKHIKFVYNIIQENKKEFKKYDNKIEELIQNHHEQALLQSKIQFWFSLIAAFVGFVFIIVMVSFSQGSQWYEYIVKTIPGIIIEAVSVLFFSQSKETRERASDFLNRLREDRQYEKAIDIAETIENEETRSKLKSEIALHLCGIKDRNSNPK